MKTEVARDEYRRVKCMPLNYGCVLPTRFLMCREMLFHRYSGSVDKRKRCKWMWQPLRGSVLNIYVAVRSAVRSR